MRLLSNVRIVLWALLALLVFGLGIGFQQWLTRMPVEKKSFHGTVLEKARSIPAFELNGTNHKPVNHQYLQGHWTFIFFGFSHCASVCPVTMAELGKMYRLIAQDSHLPRPQVLMITLDPKRDDLQRMQEYVHAFHPDFLGATGSMKNVQILTRDMGIAYTRVPTNTKSKDDNIEHSGAIMLINPQEELVAFFTPPHQADLIVNDYRLLTTK